LFEVGTCRVLGSARDGSLTASLVTPNSTYVALVARDYSSRVWDIEKSREVARLVNDEGWSEPTTVSGFSPDGQYAVTEGSSYWPVTLWPLTLHDPVAAACAGLSRNLTPDEWHRYLGREPYRGTCTNLP